MAWFLYIAGVIWFFGGSLLCDGKPEVTVAAGTGLLLVGMGAIYEKLRDISDSLKDRNAPIEKTAKPSKEKP